MKLVASLIVKNELRRYLEPCVAHLLEFVDEVRAIDDGSTDGSWEWLRRQPGVELAQSSGRFFEHEGRARQELLEWTLAGAPTHVLAIDADEFVSDGQTVRRLCERPGDVWTLRMTEVWKAFDGCLCVRWDGGWRPRNVPILYRVPDPLPAAFRVRDAALACGREPEWVSRQMQRRQPAVSGVDVFHFGWANEAERAARHDRYTVADGGRFHRSEHLDSIVWPDGRVEMEGTDWPPELEQWRPTIISRGGR